MLQECFKTNPIFTFMLCVQVCVKKKKKYGTVQSLKMPQCRQNGLDYKLTKKGLL